jgi:hypothetical protein
MNSSATISRIDTKASLHVSWALPVEEHSGPLFNVLNQQHLFYSVVDNQLPAY